ncbi:L-threonine-O-3-phosphate decarboxylase [Gloeomargarita lithophora Alchichica-D10]|uniref:threonine-phosphate decarboxylase n=1 Tax=Gloeomargarita lithophora Alchichica-D10 TaxID=1188229 RepID=A0A1J0AFY0_9CYAN|nr:threonine-phosphate decarboxylase CobD [Gloeomargarita lithophora]APB34846.1 L-threonine-O-3-phosphate decarboxylase [Gloeomargarita lithophora Alchichica-D10]
MPQPRHGGDRLWAGRIAGCDPEAILDFSANLNPLGAPAWVKDFLGQNLHLTADYPDPNYRELRRGIGAFHHLEPAWVWPGNGAAHLLTWLGRDLASQGVVTLVTPAFGDHWRALRAFDADVKTWVLPWEQNEIHLPKVGQGLLLSNPHNPTGYLFTKTQLQALLDTWNLVVIDESFMDFLSPERSQSLISLLPQYDNLVILRSLTKFYGLAGLRLGYVLAHPDRIQQYQQWDAPWSVNGLAAALGGQLLQDREFQERTWEWLALHYTQLFQGLALIPGLEPYPSAANFILVKTTLPAPELQRRLLVNHQILIRDTVSYPELGWGYFRVAVRQTQDNQKLLTALRSERITP